MSELIIRQVNEFFIMLCCGILMGVFYQILDTYQKRFIKSPVILWTQDIVFWISMGIILAQFLYYASYGKMAFYGFLGIIGGLALWFGLLSQTFHKILRHIYDIIKR